MRNPPSWKKQDHEDFCQSQWIFLLFQRKLGNSLRTTFLNNLLALFVHLTLNPHVSFKKWDFIFGPLTNCKLPSMSQLSIDSRFAVQILIWGKVSCVFVQAVGHQYWAGEHKMQIWRVRGRSNVGCHQYWVLRWAAAMLAPTACAQFQFFVKVKLQSLAWSAVISKTSIELKCISFLVFLY